MSWLFASIRWPRYWSFSFSISPSDEYSGLISFGICWFDLPAVQGAFKSLLRHHSSKALILWCSTFFMVQLAWPSCKWNPIFLDFIPPLLFPGPSRPTLWACSSRTPLTWLLPTPLVGPQPSLLASQQHVAFTFKKEGVIMFSCSVVSDSLHPLELQHARPPCPSHSPGVCLNSCPLSRWCHPTVSSFVPFSWLQSFPASGSFPLSQPFTSGGQSIGVSASASVSLMNIQDWSPLGWTCWISLQGTLKSLLQHHSSKASIRCLAFFMVHLSHPYITTRKP